MNFTSEYLAVLKKLGRIDEICDQDGLPVQTISFADSGDWKRRKPKIIYDKFLEDENLIKPIIEESKYRILRDEGMEIVSVRVRKKKKKWFKGQTVSYQIDWKNTDKMKVGRMPSKHKLIYDSANQRFQLRGQHCRNSYRVIGESDWFPPASEKSAKKELDISLPSGQKVIFENKGRYGIQKIEDIPVMIGMDGSIICVPHRAEPNNIIVVGKKGVGKTLLLHRILDEVFWMLGEKVVIMNDIQAECMPWNKEQDNQNWINQLEVINELPLSLPILYIYPHTNDLNLDYVKLKDEINFVQITIPFSEVIDKANVYLKLGDSVRYVIDLKNDLLNCEMPSDIKMIVEEKYFQPQMRSMVNKMLVSFNNVFHDEILNITNKEYPYQIKIGEELGNPFVVLAKNDLIPCFETSNLLTKRYSSEVFAYHLNSIFQNKFKNGLLYGETVHILFDEISQICDDNNQNSVYDSLCTIATRGRRLLIGLLIATQNYSKIPRKIKSNTDYVFAFQHSNAEEVKRIRDDFSLNELDWKEILNLDDFELMGITNEYFVCYKNGKKWTEKNPVRGTLLPPLSAHLKPS